MVITNDILWQYWLTNNINVIINDVLLMTTINIIDSDDMPRDQCLRNDDQQPPPMYPTNDANDNDYV